MGYIAKTFLILNSDSENKSLFSVTPWFSFYAFKDICTKMPFADVFKIDVFKI